jgi:hypothetical protein
MKISLIHNQYKRNPYFIEAVRLGLHALRNENIDYEYIIFNDNGDIEIEQDAKEFLSDPRVKYIYSPTNFGHKICTGGWIGALPHITGDFIHNMGQDDIFTPLFYRTGMKLLTNDESLMLVHFNAFACNEKLEIINIMLSPNNSPDYYNNPFECWKMWFGVGDRGQDNVTRANNNFLAPGVIYRKKLHDLIGLPDIDTFLGASDFEFWARVLFYRYRCISIPLPTWLYRQSKHSTSSCEHADILIQSWVEKVRQKYWSLYRAIEPIKL